MHLMCQNLIISYAIDIKCLFLISYPKMSSKKINIVESNKKFST